MALAKYLEDNLEIMYERYDSMKNKKKETDRMLDFVYSTCENRYEKFEENCKNHERRCIDGRITGSNKCVGYCQYEMHSGFLTKELRKQHNCLGKGCFYYVQKMKDKKQ